METAGANLAKKVKPLNSFNTQEESNKDKIFAAEVIDVIEDEKHPLYTSPHSLEAIKFRSFKSLIEGYAYPLNSYYRKLPLIHESVLIVQGNNPESGVNNESLSYYYLDIINVWNLINHNLSPYSTEDIRTEEKSNINNYTNFTGNFNKPKSVEPGAGFNNSIPRLKLFKGDIMHFGRWGNSIRFGSTNINKNFWSSRGNNGEPIIIFRSHISENKDINEIETEDINKDLSSIYLCSNHNIPIDLSSDYLNSYKGSGSSSKYISTKNYTGSQVIFKSGRIIFNASNDYLILSSKLGTSINSKGSVNIDTEKSIIIDAKKKIELGAKAKQPAVLGDKNEEQLKDIWDAIGSIHTTLLTFATAQSTVVSALTPLSAMAAALTTLNQGAIQGKIKAISNKAKTNTTKSKKVNIE